MDAAHAAGMGVVFDTVPNHMCILGDANHWWGEVLEDGPAASSAGYFDIDWDPPKSELAAKILLPFLGEQYGRVLESELAVAFKDGGFVVSWNGGQLPLSPETWSHVVDPALASLRAAAGAEDPGVLELESIARALAHTLPALRQAGAERAVERRHEKQAIRRRLAELVQSNPAVDTALRGAIAQLNGVPGVPASFDALERLMNDQVYRLAHWRVAAHEINYRRFFDINDLAAIRVETAPVFDAVHALPLSVASHPAFTGFRVDHLDGLADPKHYLDAVGAAWRGRRGDGADDARPYVIVEKILAPGESLRTDLAADGTTGYDFIAFVARLLTSGEGWLRLRAVAAQFSGPMVTFDEMAGDAKRLVLKTTLAAELTVLARRLDRISEQHRYTRDFTLNHLHAALAEAVACFSVYRTYVREPDGEVGGPDARAIRRAIADARRRNPLINASLFDFIEVVLLHRDPPGLDAVQIQARREFVTRFQQLTGPVLAKGIEDTAFYRYLPLVALNEVGGDPMRPETSDEDLHAVLGARLQTPHTLSASATHDTKRGEDTRARLYVLSEIADVWAAAIARWTLMNAQFKTTIDEADAPIGAEEYLLYQTLVGTWPMRGRSTEPDFAERIAQYMTKARREAKLVTSYINPNPPYEKAAEAFVAAVLDPARNAAFLDDIETFVTAIVRGGVYNSLAQLVLKLAAPGVPDFFQGSEAWDFTLVDPDNRRLVDLPARVPVLNALFAAVEARGATAVEAWFRQPADGHIKTWITAAGLRLRQARQALFQRGDYEPLAVEGPAARHAFAFARRDGAQAALAIVGRQLTSWGVASPVGEAWRDTIVRLPRDLASARLRDGLTGRELTVVDGVLRLESVFASLPVALLETRA